MPNRWTKVKLAYDFLSDNNGQEVTSKDIATATNCELSTARTYIAKKWAGILEPLGKDRL